MEWEEPRTRVGTTGYGSGQHQLGESSKRPMSRMESVHACRQDTTSSQHTCRLGTSEGCQYYTGTMPPIYKPNRCSSTGRTCLVSRWLQEGDGGLLPVANLKPTTYPFFEKHVLSLNQWGGSRGGQRAAAHSRHTPCTDTCGKR